MQVMLLEAPRRPLRLVEVPDPAPGPGQILIAVKACGVCRTDLHVANAAFAFAMPEGFTDAEAAPLLCAGLIGYRTLVASGPAERLGIYGFGAAGHLVAQVARHQGRRVFAFTRPGDAAAKQFALDLGRSGQATRITPRPNHSMPRSSSRRWGCSSRPRSRWW